MSFGSCAPSDPFAGDWFHATAAFMLRGVSMQKCRCISRARRRLMPDDARVLFDRACYAEIQGLPVIQVLLSDVDPMLLARGAGANQSLRFTAAAKAAMTRTARTAVESGHPAEKMANEEAERLFRRALHADPAFTKPACVSARLLVERKRHEEALAELDTALAGETGTDRRVLRAPVCRPRRAGARADR